MFIHLNIHIFINACMCLPVHMCVCVGVYTYIYVYACKYMYVYIHISIHMYIYVHIHICMCIYIYTYANIYGYAYKYYIYFWNAFLSHILIFDANKRMYKKIKKWAHTETLTLSSYRDSNIIRDLWTFYTEHQSKFKIELDVQFSIPYKKCTSSNFSQSGINVYRL